MKKAEAQLEQEEELQPSQLDEQQSVMRLEYERLLEKAHDDLARKNEIERELQGQVDRLHKKLDQTNAEFKNERDAARVDVDSIREELHSERSARSAERAEMASRQRELKEQLAAIATQHEEKIVNHGADVEQAALANREEEQLLVQQMREIQAETEDHLERLQQELTQAHAEISTLVQREKTRCDEEHILAEEREQLHESSLEQLRTQAGQLVQERDEALEEQQTLREKVNSLRAEVEVSRGLMGSGQEQVEDPAQLRRELNEARMDVQIAVRLRSEAEEACASLRDEREALQKQINNNITLGKPLNLPSPDTEQAEVNRAVYEAQPVKKPRARPASIKALAAVAVKRTRESAGAVTAAWRPVAMVLGVILIAGLGYGLKAIVDSPPAAITQQDNAAAPGPVADGQDPVAGQEAMAVANTAPVTPDPQVNQTSTPAARAAQVLDLLETAIGPVIGLRDKPSDDPVATQVPGTDRPPETGTESATWQQGLAAQGSFRDRLKDNSLAPLMVKLPAGSFLMGSQGTTLNFDEGPQHGVKLSRFSISKHEVTFAEYDKFARATGVRLPYDEAWGRGERPVVNVSWNDAKAYVRWLSAQTGRSYRLPTESQWEFAARGAEQGFYPWDEDTAGVPANCFDCGSEWDQKSTAPVGRFPANRFGLHDMGGNVQEWTEDCYHKGYTGAPGDGRARQISGCTRHTVRGGGYTSPLNSLRGTSRGQYDQDVRLDNLGFRIIRIY